MSQASSEMWEDFHIQKKKLEDRGIEAVLFNPQRIAYSNPLFFDLDENGPLAGRQVLVDEGPISAVGVSPIDFEPWVGDVIAHCHNRVIVQYPGLGIYVGWLDESEVRPLDIFFDAGNFSAC